MDTLIAIILNCYITAGTPPQHYIVLENRKAYKLCDTIPKEGFYNYFMYGMAGNTFKIIIKDNEVKNIIAK